MFVLDDIALIGLIASLSGAAMQMHAQTQAHARQQRAIQEAMQRQRQFQQQAEQAVRGRTEDFTPEAREARQAEQTKQMQDTLLKHVQTYRDEHEAAPTPGGHLSQDYLKARAQSQANQEKSAQALAHLLGQTGAASQLRQQEGFDLDNTGQTVDRIGNNAQGTQQVDNLAIQRVGIPSPWKMLAGQVLQGVGSFGMGRGAGLALNGLTTLMQIASRPSAPQPGWRLKAPNTPHPFNGLTPPANPHTLWSR